MRNSFILIIVVAFFVVLFAFPVATKVNAHDVFTYTHLPQLAIFLAPEDPILRFNIANYYFSSSAYNIKKAENYFLQALKIDQSLQGLHYQLARIYFVQGKFYTALEKINKEIELYPDFKRSYYVRGLIYGYTDRLPEAESDFKEFLKWKPDSWAGNNDLAWILFQQGKYAETRDVALAGLAIAPNNLWLLNSLGLALLNTNDKEGAREAFTKALAASALMSESDWGVAYPGNNPKSYAEGFSKTKESIKQNMELLSIGDNANQK